MGPSIPIVFALAAALQAPQASVAGVVTDADTGRPIAAATIELVEGRTGVLSDEAGTYTLTRVPAGPQHLRVTQIGYASRTVHALVPNAGVLVLDIALRAEPVQLQGLDVQSRRLERVSAAGRPGAGGGRSMSAAAIRAHPLLAEPDAFRALAGRGVVVDPESPYGLHVRGADATHTGFALDGIPVLNPVHTAGLFSAWSTDALEGIALGATGSAFSLPDALSGVVEGTVRSPGLRTGAEATVSTTHAGLTAHGPLADAGYVLSFRSGFPGLPAPNADPSYLRGEAGDALVAVHVPGLGGKVEALYYSSDNELTLGRLTDVGTGATVGGGPSEWTSRSLGLTWRREGSGHAVEVKSWRATATTVSSWLETSGPWALASDRADLGAQVTVRRDRARSSTEVGVRLWRVATDYALTDSTLHRYDARTPVLAVFGERATGLGARFTLRLGGGLSASRGHLYAPGQLEVAWSPGDRWSLHASAARTQQFTQSLVNTESIARLVLPYDLPVAAGPQGVPVPRSDQLELGAEWLPIPGVRVAGDAYVRLLRDLLLVAPTEPGPFASAPPQRGSGHARGLSLEASGSSARVGWIARYDWQRISRQAERDFQPAHGAAHILSAGLMVHPDASWSLRVSADATLGRRGSEVRGPFEWEACNLVDGGCEFAGAPRVGGTLGGTRLPAYVRADLGIRKHWHLSIGGRSTTLGAYGTVVNVLGRGNVLTYVRDGLGTLSAADMLPTGPLVVGLDWRF